MGIFTKTDILMQIPISSIRPSPNQPRKDFDETSLEELACSIAVHGILQPLTLRRNGEEYILIAGERRLRAAKTVGMTTVPCIVLERDEQESAVLSLIENVQRKDLSFYEEITALAAAMENGDMTQNKLAHLVGKSPSAIANKLRLLKLSHDHLIRLSECGATERHGRAILALDEGDREKAVSKIEKEGLNVAKTEKYVEELLKPKHSVMRRGVVRDVRIFINTVDRAVGMMKESGIHVDMEKHEEEDHILMTIKIPRSKTFIIEREEEV